MIYISFAAFCGLPRDEERSDEFYVAAGLGVGPRIPRPERGVLPVAPPRNIRIQFAYNLHHDSYNLNLQIPSYRNNARKYSQNHADCELAKNND